ncbi:MAG TPA: hypothetical protein VGF55_26770 [Gemmataceae bacterium]
MDELVRSELADLLKAGGRNLCTMPRMLGILLRQRCPDASGPVHELEQALAFGCVGPILAAVGPVDEAELADRLAEESGMTPERARWAIASWVQALNAADTPSELARDWSSWNRLDVSAATAGGTGAYQRAVGHLVTVGAAGAAGGAGLGLYLLSRGDAGLIEPWREALEDLAPWLQITALLALGMLGGFVGGLLGWIVAGGRSWTYDAEGGTTLGRLAFSAMGAFHGAGVGVMACLGLIGLIGALLGALVGGLVGAVLGLLIAEGISRYWW